MAPFCDKILFVGKPVKGGYDHWWWGTCQEVNLPLLRQTEGGWQSRGLCHLMGDLSYSHNRPPHVSQYHSRLSYLPKRATVGHHILHSYSRLFCLLHSHSWPSYLPKRATVGHHIFHSYSRLFCLLHSHSWPSYLPKRATVGHHIFHSYSRVSCLLHSHSWPSYLPHIHNQPHSHSRPAATTNYVNSA